MITAGHGVGPTTISTGHSREYVPILLWGHCRPGGRNLGIREKLRRRRSDGGAVFQSEVDGGGGGDGGDGGGSE